MWLFLFFLLASSFASLTTNCVFHKALTGTKEQVSLGRLEAAWKGASYSRGEGWPLGDVTLLLAKGLDSPQPSPQLLTPELIFCQFPQVHYEHR